MQKAKAKTNQWFTTIELLVVIAIIGVLVMGVSQVDFNAMTSRQKRDRIGSAVTTLLRNEITKNSTGKAILDPATSALVFPSKTNVILSEQGISAEYYSWSTILRTETLVTKPFYGETNYRLDSGTGRIAGWSLFPFSFWSGEALIMELQNGKSPVLYYSGTTRTDLIWAEVQLWYAPEYTKLTIDGRSNLVQFSK